jgi:hypothetical protein
MVLVYGVVQPVRRHGDGDDKDQIEEQFERGGDPMRLARRSRDHAVAAVWRMRVQSCS